MMILFTSSFVPYSFASIESEALEDVLAGCRDGQTLVYRAAYLDYVCVDPSTAIRWVELGLAEIAQEAVESDPAETIETPKPLEESKFPGAPPPAPKPTIRDTSDDSECREGQILILKLSYSDTMCTSMDTALKWERLGIAEIIENEESFDKTSQFVVDDSAIESVSEETNLEETNVESVSEEENIPNLDKCESLDSSSSIMSPSFLQVSNSTWVVFGDDVVNGAFIEGDDGIIAINTLNCYEVAKQTLDELRSFIDKPIKIIIFTSVSEELVDGSRAFLEEGDDDVEFIIHDNLMESLTEQVDSEEQTIHSFSSRFGIDVSGIELKLIHVEDEYHEYLYIHQPQRDALLVGNDSDGLFPFLIHLDNFQ